MSQNATSPVIENECMKLGYVVGAIIAGLAISAVALYHGLFMH
jgi:hypothetical protein